MTGSAAPDFSLILIFMRLHAIRLTWYGEPILMKGTSNFDPESGGGSGDLATILDLDDISFVRRQLLRCAVLLFSEVE